MYKITDESLLAFNKKNINFEHKYKKVYGMGKWGGGGGVNMLFQRFKKSGKLLSVGLTFFFLFWLDSKQMKLLLQSGIQ